MEIGIDWIANQIRKHFDVVIVNVVSQKMIFFKYSILVLLIILFTEKKNNMAKQAEFYSKTHAKEIAMNTLDKLHELDQQRELIIAELEDAKENVVKFDHPEAKAEELSELAKGFFDFTKFIFKKRFLNFDFTNFLCVTVPDTPEEELDTLVNVANAVINSEVELDPKVKEALEIKILDHIGKK